LRPALRVSGTIRVMASQRGSGPGVITPDGSAVELYSLLPAGDGPEVVHGAIPQGASILELGAGVGRMTHPLVEYGHPVVAVDESPEMLERIRGAETIQAKIQELDLGRRFDAVLLASHFINVPDEAFRHRLLRTCRRHVDEGGCVLIERHEPSWFDEAGAGERVQGGIVSRLRDVSRPGPGLLSATVEHQVGERVWAQWFTARRVDDVELAGALAEAQLAVDAYLTDDGTWVRAVPR
jgi:SAM-dependent methyltransferase